MSAEKLSTRAISVPNSYTPVSDVDTPRHGTGLQPNQFIWNGRTCTGSALHLAALGGDVQAVEACLKSGQGVLQERFTYETVFNGNVQEGSGEAIHLAASRCHVEVVKILLDAKASLTAYVSRDHKPHFDVLHAATFAEGRGGSFDVIKHLIDSRAEMTKNLDGRYPLHVAYLTGNVPVINHLRARLADQGKGIEDFVDAKVPLPLSLGISGGKMSEDQLSASAELNVRSLTTFIHECPQCIPSFLKRFQDAEHVSAEDLAKTLTRFDIASVVRESPEAAVALLESTTDEPVCSNKGWHPLPSRVSFATRSWLEKVRVIFNPPRTRYTFYEKDHIWAYDSNTYVAPSWHETLTDRSFGRPIVDADIRVCHIPDLLCAEIFTSLCDPVNADADVLWEDPVIDSMITHVFWNGACRPELTWVMLTFWGLALLIAEEVFLKLTWVEEAPGETATERLLRPHAAGGHKHSGHGGERGQQLRMMHWDWNAPFQGSATNSWVAISWISCKSLADLYMEAVQFQGYKAVGRMSRYFAWDNLCDVCISLIPLFLFFDHEYLPVVVLSVVVYWNRLLDCFAAAEFFGNEILPIRNLSSGLMPALFVTGIAFGAFTHAFYIADGSAERMFPDVFLESFSSLITAALPAKADDVSPLKLVLVLGAVMYFAVFILNIFIGVITELYLSQKERVAITFKQVRADACLQFLLRCKILPCRLTSVRNGVILTVLACCIALSVQIYCFFNHGYQPWVTPVFLVCQLIIMVGSYQDPDSPFVLSAHGPADDRYMWLCERRAEESVEELASKDEAPILAGEQDVNDLREAVHGVKNEMQSMLGQFEEVKSVLKNLKRDKK